MNTRTLSLFNIGTAMALLCLFFYLSPAVAEPYLAVKTGMKCSSCHINPTGGGARNSYGTIYGSQFLPRSASKASNLDFGAINSAIRVGGDIRANSHVNNQDDDGFDTQSAQLYFHITPENSIVSFYLDQQYAPSSSLNREALIMVKPNENHMIKMGTMRVPFGLYFEDDTAFVREATQTNFDTRDTGISYVYANAHNQIDLTMTNGTSATSNNDDKFQVSARAEHIKQWWRLGVSGLSNEFDTGDRVIGNIFFGLNFSDYILMAEFNRIEDSDEISGDASQDVWLVELNKEVIKGLNLKFTTEYHNPNTDIESNEKERYSFVAEYTPVSNFQIRGGARLSSDDSKQEQDKDFNQVFAEAHVYF